MTFRVEQKVVCVNDGRPWKSWRSWLGHKWMEFRHPYDHPVIGVIYTVTDIQSSSTKRIFRSSPKCSRPGASGYSSLPDPAVVCGMSRVSLRIQ